MDQCLDKESPRFPTTLLEVSARAGKGIGCDDRLADAVVVPMNVLMKAEEIRYYLEDSAV